MGNHGLMVNGVPFPAVPKKQTRIRMTVTSEMTTEQLDKGYTGLCNAINQYQSGKDDSIKNISEPALAYNRRDEFEKIKLNLKSARN